MAAIKNASLELQGGTFIIIIIIKFIFSSTEYQFTVKFR